MQSLNNLPQQKINLEQNVNEMFTHKDGLCAMFKPNMSGAKTVLDFMTKQGQGAFDAMNPYTLGATDWDVGQGNSGIVSTITAGRGMARGGSKLQNYTTGKVEQISATGKTAGDVLSGTYDSQNHLANVHSIDFQGREYEIGIDYFSIGSSDKWIVGLNTGIDEFNRITSALMDKMSDYNDELFSSYLFGSQKDFVDPRDSKLHIGALEVNTSQPNPILPPAFLNHFTLVSAAGKTAQPNQFSVHPGARLWNVVSSTGRGSIAQNASNPGFLNTISKIREFMDSKYYGQKTITIREGGQMMTVRGVVVVPDPLYTEIIGGFGEDTSIRTNTANLGARSNNPTGGNFAFNSKKGFMWDQFWIRPTNLYPRWLDGDVVPVCAADGTTNYVKLSGTVGSAPTKATLEGATTEANAQNIGGIGTTKALYRIPIVTADAIHMTEQMYVPDPTDTVAVGNGRGMVEYMSLGSAAGYPRTQLAKIHLVYERTAGDRSVIITARQYQGMKRIRWEAKTQGGGTLVYDAGLFALDLIYDK